MASWLGSPLRSCVAPRTLCPTTCQLIDIPESRLPNVVCGACSRIGNDRNRNVEARRRLGALAGRRRCRFEHSGRYPADVLSQRFGVVCLKWTEFGVGDELLEYFLIGIFSDCDRDAHRFASPRLVHQRLQTGSEVVSRLTI